MRLFEGWLPMAVSQIQQHLHAVIVLIPQQNMTTI
jgi:hypothetical protein